MSLKEKNQKSATKKVKKAKSINIGQVIVFEPEVDRDYFTIVPPDNPIARILTSRYFIDINVGKGAYSTVYKCKCKNTGELRAIKAIDLTYLKKNKKDMPLLINELTTVITLEKEHHENIVKIYQHFGHDGWLFFVMEYCPGGDLYDYINKYGTMKEELARYWFQQICEGLQFLHQKLKIAHRDIKLENILFKNNVAKLTDFTFAKRSWNDKDNKPILSDTCCGTNGYLGPQKVRLLHFGQEYNPYADDIWALGTTLFIMLNGIYPYGTEPNIRIIEDPFYLDEYINEHSNSLKDLFTKMFTVIEDKRIKIDQVLKHKWVNHKRISVLFRRFCINQ